MQHDFVRYAALRNVPLSGSTDFANPGSSARAVGIISSAGGIPALLQMLAALPPGIPYPLFVSQHFPRNTTSLLPELLGRHCALEVTWACDGETPRAGVVYAVRPADALRLAPNRMQVTAQAPHWRSWLDSADAFLASMADAYGAGAIAVVLSGMLPVGVNGLNSIRRAGGLVIAQNKSSAKCFEMPAAARDLAKSEISLPPAGIAKALCAMADGAALLS
jgi:two-component system chemotaxis response regulator CheB